MAYIEWESEKCHDLLIMISWEREFCGQSLCNGGIYLIREDKIVLKCKGPGPMERWYIIIHPVGFKTNVKICKARHLAAVILICLHFISLGVIEHWPEAACRFPFPSHKVRRISQDVKTGSKIGCDSFMFFFYPHLNSLQSMEVWRK